MKLERRLTQPWWLSVAVPVGSLIAAFAIVGVVLALTGRDPWETYREIVDAGFTGNGAMSATLISATPILFTGLAAAAAFREVLERRRGVEEESDLKDILTRLSERLAVPTEPQPISG